MDFNHVTYSTCYKLLKGAAKANPYVKEQFTKKESLWHIGNIGESKYVSTREFEKYFKENIPTIYNEIKHYVMAHELNEQLEKRGNKTSKMKI